VVCVEVAMSDLHQYQAIVRLKTLDIWDLDGRENEIAEIANWVDELVGWHRDQYEAKLVSSKNEVHYWFKNEEHAVMCILRWQ
jgi:hypothetical protein